MPAGIAAFRGPWRGCSSRSERPGTNGIRGAGIRTGHHCSHPGQHQGRGAGRGMLSSAGGPLPAPASTAGPPIAASLQSHSHSTPAALPGPRSLTGAPADCRKPRSSSAKGPVLVAASSATTVPVNPAAHTHLSGRGVRGRAGGPGGWPGVAGLLSGAVSRRASAAHLRQ